MIGHTSHDEPAASRAAPTATTPAPDFGLGLRVCAAVYQCQAGQDRALDDAHAVLAPFLQSVELDAERVDRATLDQLNCRAPFR